MDSYIVRQAIVTAKPDTYAYEILYNENSSEAESTNDASAAHAIENFLSSMDSERFLDGRVAFLTFTHNLLEKGIPKMFKTNKLVIQIEDSLITNPLSQELIEKYKKSGYSIAVVDFEFAPRFFGVLDMVDYVKVDFSNKSESLENIIKIGQTFGKKIIAYNIKNQQDYDLAVKLKCNYFQGAFVSEKTPTTVKKVNYLQSNFFQLMVAVTKDEPNIEEIENIVSRDVSLTFSLLKLVNSAYFALRNKARSVKQALIILGLGQLKQWIYLLSFKQDDGSTPDELIKISFLRATFASELVDFANDMPISRSEAYLLGMFSTLGKLMDVPIEDALNQLPVSEEIKNALLNQEGKAGSLYKLILSYERADWKSMSACADELGIPQSMLAPKYFECVESVNNIWRGLTQSNEDAAD